MLPNPKAIIKVINAFGSNMLNYPRNCTSILFNQTEPEKEEVDIVEQSMQVNDISFEFATDFINQCFQLFNSFPLKVLTPDRIVKQVILPNLL